MRQFGPPAEDKPLTGAEKALAREREKAIERMARIYDSAEN